MKLAIAGGTGVVGRHLVELAEASGHEVVVLARSRGVDVCAGTGPQGSNGIRDFIVGADAVIDVTSTNSGSEQGAIEFFEAVTRNLQMAELEAGVGHHITLSIVGAARANSGYYAGKAAQERAVEGGGVPWTILRATQFHEFAGQISSRARVAGITLVPVMRSQPLAARAVAARLLEIAEGGAPVSGRGGYAPDIAGPREERMVDLVRKLFTARGKRGPVLAVPLPGGFGKALRDGTILPGPDAQLDALTFDEWLAELSVS